jgi:hypothetical protein
VNGVEMFVVRLSEFSALAWATLKADLLFVIWELMGGKTRLQTQQVQTRGESHRCNRV